MNKIEKFRFKFFGIPLIRLAYKLRLFVFKKALDTQLSLNTAMKMVVRSLIKDAPLPGVDEVLDKKIHITTFLLLNPEIFDKAELDYIDTEVPEEVLATHDRLQSDYEKMESDISKIINLVKDDPNIKQILQKYCLVKSFSDKFRDNRKGSIHYLNRAAKLNSDSSPMEAKDLWIFDKEAKQLYKRYRRPIGDRAAVKLTLSPNHIGLTLSLLSCVFLTSGYAYESIYLGAFNINVSNYFSLGDYLASSISTIRYAALSTLLGLITLLLRLHGDSRQTPYELEYNDIQDNKMYYILLMSSISMVLFGYIKNKEIMFMFLPLLCILLIVRIPWRFYEKYFKQPLSAQFTLIVLLVYFSYIAISAFMDIDKARNISPSKLAVAYTFDPSLHTMDKRNLYLLRANSQFFFFLDLDSHEPVIINKRHVSMVRSQKKDVR